MAEGARAPTQGPGGLHAALTRSPRAAPEVGRGESAARAARAPPTRGGLASPLASAHRGSYREELGREARAPRGAARGGPSSPRAGACTM